MQQFLSGNRAWLIAAAAFVVCVGVAYFAGSMGERAARTRDAQAAEARYAALNTQMQSTQAQLQTQQSVGALLASHVGICRATVALDNRNFGVATNAVASAVASLGKVDAAAAGLEAEALQGVSARASSVQISVAQNLGAQRTQLLRLAEDIDALVTKSGGAAR